MAMGLAVLAAQAPSPAAEIGVLSDGRQAEYLSLLGSSSAAARLALQQDGHTLNTLPSLDPVALALVDIVWLPLLDVSQAYTVQEQLNLRQFVIGGGRIVWIGDADVYNAGDDSFLAAFDMHKLIGNLDAGLTPDAPWAGHPVVTGPHGAVGTIGTNAGYGLFSGAADVAGVFVGTNEESPPQTGVFVGFLDASSGFAGSGRVAFVGDASIFGQNLDQSGQSHRALLRNIVKWAATEPPYTPVGTQVRVGPLAAPCAACTTVDLVFDAVIATGETTASPIGSGRCGFAGIPQSALPVNFIGYGSVIQTTAVLPDPTSVMVTIIYDEADLTALSLAESALTLLRYDAAGGACVNITTTLNTNSNTITGVAPGVGRFLLGGIVPTPDCNANGVPDGCDLDLADPDGNGDVSRDCDANGLPDECQIDAGSTAPGGPFHCTADCDPDCNHNGIPDACDLNPADPDGNGAVSRDCDADGVPGECQIDAGSTAPGGPFYCTADCAPDCNHNGVPDACDLNPSDPDGNGTVSKDCDANGLPDECQIDIGSTAPGGPFYCTADCAPDCNANGVPDACDLNPTDPDGNGHTSPDCNASGVPDECETDLLPHIVQQPAGLAVCAGTPATFSVVAGGIGPFTYEWRKGAANIPGATQVEYTIAIVTPSNAGVYDVIVRNACGAVISDAATLTVNTGPTITQQPTGQSVCLGGAAGFTIAASGAGNLTYRWSMNGQALTDGGAISGATTATLGISPAAPEHAGEYLCTVTDDCETEISAAAHLAIDLPPQITQQPTDLWVCASTQATFTITAAGAGLTYQWQFDANGGGQFVDLTDGAGISGATAAGLTIHGVTAASAGDYRCIVRGTCGGPVTSDAAALSVGALVQVGSGPADRFACPGDAVSFTVTAGGSDLAYRWQFNSGGGDEDLVDGGDISGATTPTLAIAGVSAARAGLYRCVVSGSCGNPIGTSHATLTVGAPPTILWPPSDVVACLGGTAAFEMGAVGTGCTYRWQFDGGAGFANLADGDGVSGATTHILTLVDISAAAAGQYRCVVTGACGAPVTSDAAALTVGAPAAIQAGPTSRTVCPGAAVTFSMTASGSSLTYAWQINRGVAYENVADGNGISGATTNMLAIQTAMPAHAGLYRCIAYASCGAPAVTDAATLAVAVGQCDCNNNGIPDAEDIAAGTSRDCNANGVPDECDISLGTSADCDGNGTPDDCDIDPADPDSDGSVAPDCNGNGVPDNCDLAAGTSRDCNADGIPDECQLGGDDCDRNGVPDECDPPYVAEAGGPRTICVNVASPPLGGDPIAGGSRPPYSFLWRVIGGPAGGGTVLDPTAAHPRFVATIEGAYVVELIVADSTQPPCVTTDTVTITATRVTVNTGASFGMCVGATSAALPPVVSGGIPPYGYAWSIDAGSPGTALSQFTGSGPNSPNPTFTPSAAGHYALRLTVTDSADAPCVVAHVLLVHASQLAVAPPADFAMCLGGASAPLQLALDLPGIAPLGFAWSIEPGSPSTTPAQFTGSGPNSPSPTFTPSLPGQYVLRATVLDSGTPPCRTSVTFHVNVGTLTVDAGTEQAVCTGGGVRLAPSLVGGVPPFTYAWSIEPGSPNLALAQFSDPHNFAAGPLFRPIVSGDYTLRLTVTDSATPPCTAFDTVVIHATMMTVDAGPHFAAHAFEPSSPLGADPLVTGGVPPFTYAWRIISGPAVDAAQLSAANVEHPRFTPAAVGTYQLGVTVTDARGPACAAEDAVVIEAVASAQTLPVNVEGRVFMTLQLGGPDTRAEVRISDGLPGAEVSGTLRDDGAGAIFLGLMRTPGLTRRVRALTGMTAHSYIVVVVLYYDPAELGPFDERLLRVHRFETALQAWRPVGGAAAEEGPYPLRPGQVDLGRLGVDTANHCAWAVLDYLGEFAVGVTSNEPLPTTPAPAPATPESPPPASTDQPLQPSDSQDAAAMCGSTGACGAGTILPLMLTGAVAVSRRRSTQKCNAESRLRSVTALSSTQRGRAAARVAADPRVGRRCRRIVRVLRRNPRITV
jgi:hypothetical protein